MGAEIFDMLGFNPNIDGFMEAKLLMTLTNYRRQRQDE